MGKRSICRTILAIAIATTLVSGADRAQAFCGFFVAKADTKLFNKASKVVLVRDNDRTVLTMVNDYQGDPKDFALVVPVPTVLKKEQIHVASVSLVDHLDAYTAPRLVEYHDDNPCHRYLMEDMARAGAAPAAPQGALKKSEAELGVKIEATYTIGEYDIVILSAEQSSGLETWLKQEGYKIPDGAGPVLGSYLKQGMKFFVAKVNLKEHSKLGFSFLRPLQMAFESPKFMLPIRLGTVNANGTQELFIFTLTRKGRVETTNYRTTKIPSDEEIPLYVKDVFPEFYRAMFDTAVKKEDMRVVFLEYAWDMGWCDPCAADPLSASELRELGVFWMPKTPASPAPRPWGGIAPMPPGGQDVFVTRLHVRYDGTKFPEDLQFQETSDRTNFQGRYIMRHPWTGSDECDAAKEYRKQLRARQEKQAQTLAYLTGWEMDDIKEKMNLAKDESGGSGGGKGQEWWNDIWK